MTAEIACTRCGVSKPYDAKHFLMKKGRIQFVCRACSRARDHERIHRRIAELDQLIVSGDTAAITAFVRKHAHNSEIIHSPVLGQYAPDLLAKRRAKSTHERRKERAENRESGLLGNGKIPVYLRADPKKKLAEAERLLKNAKTSKEIWAAKKRVQYWSDPNERFRHRKRMKEWREEKLGRGASTTD